MGNPHPFFGISAEDKPFGFQLYLASEGLILNSAVAP